MVVFLYGHAAPAYFPDQFHHGASRVAEASAIYRPRHPERTPFYQLFDRYFDRYLGEYEERFEPRCGYLRPVVARTVSAFMECGRLQSGFARIRCPKCRGEHLLAFSCQTRNFCPSCQAKRAAQVAERLLAEVLAPVSHRHLIFTIPKVLRGLFQRERRLLAILTRSAYDALRTTWVTGFDAVELHGSKVRVKTPPDPRTGERDLLLDPLDWIHAVALQVPDPRRHLVRYYGIYANRLRTLWQGRARGLGWGTTSEVRPSLAAEEPLFLMADGRAMPMPAACDEVFRRHGLLRSPIIKRGIARPFPAEGMPSLLLRLRALLGVSIRCEILCLVGSTDEIHPSLIARLVGQVPRTTQDRLAEMVRSGAVQVRTSARAKHYALVPGVLDGLLRPGGRTPWVNSVPLFKALEIVWLGLMDPGERDLAAPLLASQWRRTARVIRPLLGDAGLGQPLRDDASFVGEAYHDGYVTDISRILALV